MNSIGIELSRLHSRYKRVPVVVSAIRPQIESHHTGGPGLVHALEEEQVYRGALFGEDAEVYAIRAYCCAERKALALIVVRNPTHRISSLRFPRHCSLHYCCGLYVHFFATAW